MKLDVLLSGLVPIPANVAASVEIGSVVDDSRLAAPGSMFVARSGSKVDGKSFVADAVSRGAVAVLHAGPDPCEGMSGAEAVMRVKVPEGVDLNRLASRVAHRIEGSPSEWLRLVGITGTNGKTTMAFLVQQFVRAAGSRCGLVGTVTVDDGAQAEPASLTTPGGIEIAKVLGRMVRNGCSACAMEVSSHALDQGRADALRFGVAVFSNLTGDHLDYHGTMERYASAKARLFAMLPPEGTAVVNADDPWNEAMLAGCRARVLRCTVAAEGQTPLAGADCTATVHNSRLGWQDTTFAGPWGAVRARLPLVGRHNAMNALEAASAAWAIGVPADVIRSALSSCAAPPGRLEPVTSPEDPFAVLVDYAHTDDALVNVLGALRPLVGGGGRLVTVFGCGGDRDRTKRPRMMRVACEGSDHVVVTSDNPRTEDPEAIIDEVMAGRPAGCRATVVRQVDRARAIRAAVEDARPGDIVLVAGKGHEDYQIVGTERRPFDDRSVAREALGAGMTPARAGAVAP